MKHCMTHSISVLVLALGMTTTFCATTQAEYQLLDRIVAIAEDDVVVASEVRDQMRTVMTNIQRSGGRVPGESLLYEQILERLILEKLQLQRAHRLGMRVSDDELNQAMRSIAQNNGLSLTDFRRLLEQEGQSYLALREKTRNDMLIQQVQQRSVMRSISISPSEVDNFLESEAGKALLQIDYSIDHILVPVDSESSAEVIEAARQTALNLAALAAEKAQFVDITNAIETANAVHSPLGWRAADALPSLLADKISSLPVGNVSEPIQSDSGFHIIRVNQTRGGVAETSTETLVSHILLKPTEIRNKEQSLALMQEILAELERGTPFSNLARLHSDDPGSALKGGDLGWTLPGVMVAEFEEHMLATNVGETSEPFESPFGWHILHVNDRRSKDLTGENAQRKARLEIAKSKYDDELKNWLQKLRDESFVEIK